LVGSGGASVSQGHTLIVFTLEPLFFTTVIFISFSQSDFLLKFGYRKFSMTTSTSQGRRVVVFFVSSVFLPFMAPPETRPVRPLVYASPSARTASCAIAVTPASKLVL
jgi:hypothetical protein